MHCLVLTLIAVAAPLAHGATSTLTCPDRPIRIIVLFAALSRPPQRCSRCLPPREAVQKVREALLIVLDQPRTRQSFEKLGGEVIKSTPDEYVRRMQEEHARWTRIRKETGIKVE